MILSEIEYNFIKLQNEKTQLYNKTYYQKRKLEKKCLLMINQKEEDQIMN